MAKKQKKTAPDQGLPQNFLAMGERVEEDKNIYISQTAYKDIHKFTKNKTTNESGGFLVGSVIEEMGKTNILIKGFVEAKGCEATPTTLTFTHETWNEAHKEIGKRFPKEKIIGWIHTHPDFGIFLSEYDKFIHQNYFNGENQVAFVVDPIQNIEGFYFWINGRLEKCRGFYIYEKTGVKIDINTEKEETGKYIKQGPSLFTGVLIGLLALAIVVLFFFNLSLNEEINKQKKEIESISERNDQLVNFIASLHPENVIIQGNTMILIPPMSEPTADPEPPTEAPTETETESEQTEPEQTEPEITQEGMEATSET